MLKKFIIALSGVAVLVLTLGAIKVAQFKQMSGADHSVPALSVSTFEAAAVNWSPILKSIGTLAPVQGVTISADADGTIVRIAADSGTAVQAGDLLVELDTTVETANLHAAEASAELSRINLERSQELWARQAIAKSDFDAATAAAQQAVASVAAIQAQIAKKRVRAPFAGRVGIRLVNLGQFVARGQSLLPLQNLDPIFVNFSIPQRQLPALVLGQTIKVVIDAFEQPFEGRITAINSEVDAATRNVSVQATLANPQELLRAGMFARVEVQLPAREALVGVPATAIAYASYGNSVYVVELMKGEDGKEYLGARQQFVKLGATRGDLVAITGGVKPGDQVVSAGVFKLRNGVLVQVNNTVQPTSNPNPTPKNT
ncbi:MAG: efflux RND transporter periplasmic adaptor subunit [Candidatus Didemnitutus sp.]|nr:efflux RND transporter periplasmic adaptor subunit [Candidatus Didemnitutus sp.]